MSYKIFCIIGRTSAGKSRLTRLVAKELNMKVLKSYTTRPPREEETDNPDESDHIFIAPDEADLLIKEQNLIAYTKIKNNRYFATLEQLIASDFYVIDVNGLEYLQNIRAFKKQDFNFEIVSIYIAAPYEIRKQRFMQRDNTTEQDFIDRNESEDAQFEKYELGNGVRYIINNDSTLENALDDFKRIVKKELERD